MKLQIGDEGPHRHGATDGLLTPCQTMNKTPALMSVVYTAGVRRAAAPGPGWCRLAPPTACPPALWLHPCGQTAGAHGCRPTAPPRARLQSVYCTDCRGLAYHSSRFIH